MTRLQLIQFLHSLSEQAVDVLEELCSLAGMPNGNFAGRTAGVSMKISAILQWWESTLCQGKIEDLYPLGKISDLTAKLYSIPGPQFSQIVFALDIPPGDIPGNMAPQRDRAKAVLKWCSDRSMLGDLENVINYVITR